MWTGTIDTIPTSKRPLLLRASHGPRPASDLLLSAFTASRTGWKAFALGKERGGRNAEIVVFLDTIWLFNIAMENPL